jgi:transcriptional regulator with XRE-family HTH domain
MTDGSRPPVRKGPAKEFGLADPPVDGGSDVSRVVSETEVVGLREPPGGLPLEDGGTGDIAGAGDLGPAAEVNGPVEGIGVSHVLHDSTVGYISSITPSYDEAVYISQMSPTDGNFWTRLLEAMRDRGLPQNQVAAAKLGRVTQPAARKWAQGGLPDVDKIIDIAQRLDVSLDWLLKGEGPKRPPKFSESDPHFALMLDIWKDLDPEARKRLVELAGLIKPPHKQR